ncbi:MAG: hypothetical protein H0X45_07805 [Planctomycetes bacterium]|nr:hypothetical protein [Planctomycetota bacterium]
MPAHILQIDDNAADIELLRVALEDSNWDVRFTGVADVAQGRAYLVEQAALKSLPNLILVDQSLVGDGPDALFAWLVAQEMAIPHRIVFTSGTSARRRTDLERSGSTGVYIKPTLYADLVSVTVPKLRELIDRDTVHG